MDITGLLPLLKDITCDFLDASGAEQTNNLLSLTRLRMKQTSWLSTSVVINKGF